MKGLCFSDVLRFCCTFFLVALAWSLFESWPFYYCSSFPLNFMLCYVISSIFYHSNLSFSSFSLSSFFFIIFFAYLTSAFFLLAAWVSGFLAFWLRGFLASSISSSVVPGFLYLSEVVVVVVVDDQ